MTCTRLKPLCSFEIRFHCASFPVSILSVAFPAHTIISQVCQIIPQRGHSGHRGHFVSGRYGIPGVAMQGLPKHVPMVGGEVQMQPQARMSRVPEDGSGFVQKGMPQGHEQEFCSSFWICLKLWRSA